MDNAEDDTLDAAERAVWVNLDYRTHDAKIHLGRCLHAKRRAETRLKGVGSLKSGGGWLPFDSVPSAQAYVEDPNRHGPKLQVSRCADCPGTERS